MKGRKSGKPVTKHEENHVKSYGRRKRPRGSFPLPNREIRRKDDDYDLDPKDYLQIWA